MLVNGFRLPSGRIMETDVVPLAEMLMQKDVGCATLEHVGRIDSPNVNLASVVVMVDHVEFHGAESADFHVDI
jgi:hypothetical protein